MLDSLESWVAQPESNTVQIKVRYHSPYDYEKAFSGLYNGTNYLGWAALPLFGQNFKVCS